MDVQPDASLVKMSKDVFFSFLLKKDKKKIPPQRNVDNINLKERTLGHKMHNCYRDNAKKIKLNKFKKHQKENRKHGPKISFFCLFVTKKVMGHQIQSHSSQI